MTFSSEFIEATQHDRVGIDTVKTFLEIRRGLVKARIDKGISIKEMAHSIDSTVEEIRRFEDPCNASAANEFTLYFLCSYAQQLGMRIDISDTWSTAH